MTARTGRVVTSVALLRGSILEEFMHTRSRVAFGALVVAMGVLVGAGLATAGGASVAIASGTLVPNGGFVGDPVDGIGPDDAVNPATGAQARVHVTVGVAGGSRTIAALHVEGLPAGRTFGAHLHRDDCSATFGGPHYQHPGGTPSAVATPENEVWLDISTNAAGRGRATTAVPFAVLAGMRSVVVHQLPSNDVGVAGQRIGCLPITI